MEISNPFDPEASISATASGSILLLHNNHTESTYPLDITITSHTKAWNVVWDNARPDDTLRIRSYVPYNVNSTVSFPGYLALTAPSFSGQLAAASVFGFVHGDFNGTLTAGTICGLTVNGNVSGQISAVNDIASGESIGLCIFGDLAAPVTASGAIRLNVYGDVTQNASIISTGSSVNMNVGGSILTNIQATGGISIAAGHFSDGKSPRNAIITNNTICSSQGSIFVSSSMDVLACHIGTGTTNGSISIDAKGSFSGSATISGGNIDVLVAKSVHDAILTILDGDITIRSGLDIGGSFSATGNISMTAGGNISGSISAGAVSTMTADGNISGTISVSGNIDTIQAGLDINSTISATGTISSVKSVQGSISGSIHAAGGIMYPDYYHPDYGITAGIDVAAALTVDAGDLYVSAQRNLTGSITGSANGSLTLFAGYDLQSSVRGGILDTLEAGHDISGASLTATQHIGTLVAGHAILSNINAQATSPAEGWIGAIIAGAHPDNTPYFNTAAGRLGALTIHASGSIGLVAAQAALGYHASIDGTTITSDATIGTLTAASGIHANASAHGSILAINPGTGDLAGSFTAELGNLPTITCNGTISATLTAGGTIGTLTATGNISGTITAGGSIGNIKSGQTIGGPILATGSIGDITAVIGDISTAANITSMSGSIGDVMAGHKISGNISADGSIGDVTLYGTLSGSLKATNGSIGRILSTGDITKDIMSHMNQLLISSGGNVVCNLSATSHITLVTLGDVRGNITTGSGNIDVRAGGSITDAVIVAAGDIYVTAQGNISANVTSKCKSVCEIAKGTISASSVTGATAVALTASKVNDFPILVGGKDIRTTNEGVPKANLADVFERATALVDRLHDLDRTTLQYEKWKAFTELRDIYDAVEQAGVHQTVKAIDDYARHNGIIICPHIKTPRELVNNVIFWEDELGKHVEIPMASGTDPVAEHTFQERISQSVAYGAMSGELAVEVLTRVKQAMLKETNGGRFDSCWLWEDSVVRLAIKALAILNPHTPEDMSQYVDECRRLDGRSVLDRTVFASTDVDSILKLARLRGTDKRSADQNFNDEKVAEIWGNLGLGFAAFYASVSRLRQQSVGELEVVRSGNARAAVEGAEKVEVETKGGASSSNSLPQSPGGWSATEGWRLPVKNGAWSGTPGDSWWKSNKAEVNQATGNRPILFRNGYIDLSFYKSAEYRFANLNGTEADFKLADQQLAIDRGFNSPNAARAWRSRNGLTWHHVEDGHTLQLVPTVLNDIPHQGGASILRGN
jgi:hypothetical protein